MARSFQALDAWGQDWTARRCKSARTRGTTTLSYCLASYSRNR